jgi:ribosomal protein L25 (general stress protein Ctc)
MTQTIDLQIEERNKDLNPRQLRAEGKLPATVYGKGQESVSIQLDRREFVLLYKKHKDSVFQLKSASTSYNTVVQKFQIEASTNKELHVEFKLV